jgi:hypothetical protein
VPGIVDGDALAIGATRVRLEGIDAPETDQICLNPAWHRSTDQRDIDVVRRLTIRSFAINLSRSIACADASGLNDRTPLVNFRLKQSPEPFGC